MAASGPRLPDSGENTAHLIPNPECSCPQCDSLGCFSRRQINKPCSCLKCENSKTCLYFPHKATTEGDLTEVKTSMEGDDILAKERVKREITYEFNEALKTRCVSQHINNVMFSGDKSGEVAQKDTNDQPLTQTDNVADNTPHKEDDSAAAKLSAQIMDVPYENLHDIFNKDSDTTSHKILVLDVLNKIRDAYKACSCKVCECLVGTSTIPVNKLCKCEPCDCNDCMSFLKKFQYLGSVEKDPPDGCPCIRCTRSQCKGIVNKFDEPQICDCPPGYSIKCEENYAKSCSCEPCQCLECKAMSFNVPNNFIVAPVGEEYQRHYCDCSPCECLECRGYGMPRTYVREAETNVNRHPRCQCETCASEACIADGAQTCKCLRRSRVMVKPIEKDVRDYDIRAIITEDKIIRNTNSKLLKNNTIAMYATVPNIYNNTGYKKECSCEVCECLLCNCKENAVDSIKSSRLFKDKIQCVTNLNSDVCKCAPCDCLVCVNKMNSQSKSIMALKSCECGACDCINCERVIKDDNKFQSCVNVFKRHSVKKSCRCSSCECIKCIESITCAGDVCHCAKYSCEQCAHESKESIYPIKKAEPLTPSLFSCEIQRDNSKNYNGDRLFVKDFGSLSSTKLCHLNITSQNDTDTYCGHPRNNLLGNNITPLTSNKETHLFPQSKYNEYQDKVHLKSIDTNIRKFNTTSHSRNIYMRWSEMHYAHSRTNASDEAVLADSRNYKYSRAASVANEDKICDNSGDSGCGSYDYSTLFPESLQADGKINQGFNQYNQAANSYPDDKNIKIGQKIKETHNEKHFIVNQNRHHHSFESENSFSRDKIEDVSVNYLGNHKTENTSQESYGRQYWIKNMDVSVAVHDENFPYSKHSSIDYDLRNNSADNTNIIQDSDENLSYSQYIGDHPLNSRRKRVEELFNNDAYYEGVQETLHRARAFSLELLKVLDKYERANNEFQSITQKLKASHASLFSDNILQATESKEEDIICLSPESSDIKTEHEEDIPIQNKYTEQKRLFSFSNDFKDHDKKGRCTQIDNSSFFNISNDSVLDEVKPESLGDFCYKNNVKRNKKSVNQCNNKFPNRKIRGIKKTNKCNTGTLKQIIIISKEGQGTTASNRVMKTIGSTQTSLQGKKYEEASTDVFSLSRSYLLTEERTVAMKNLEILPISKKNFYLMTKPVARNKGIYIIPSLQGDIKHAVRSMSIQTKTSNNENKFVPRRNEALQNLQIEVQKLLGMPILQNTQKNLCDYKEQNTTLLPQTKIDVFPNLLTSTSTPYQSHLDVDYIRNANKAMDCKSDKSCCDALKVNFLGLQRVSDHTVLVKWTAPRITFDVKGYELLVDGRAVQKILSPSRCVAVVTCLPHCETVLLTIRTITSVTPSGHFPSSTIVYHPRVK